MQNSLFILFFVLLFQHGKAQFHLKWEKSWQDNQINGVKGVVWDQQSNYYFVSVTASSENSVWSSYIGAFDGDGNMNWRKSFARLPDNRLEAVRRDESGNLLAAGYIYNTYSASKDVWLIKYTPSGKLLWTKVYGDTDEEYAYEIIAAGADNWLVVGTKSNATGEKSWIWVLKIDSNGEIVWEKKLNQSGSEAGTSAVWCKNGDFVVVGSRMENNGRSAAACYRLDRHGNIKWQKLLNRATIQGANSIGESSSGDLYLAGYATDDNNLYHAWFVKMDSTARVKNNFKIVSEYGSYIYDMVVDSLDNAVVACGWRTEVCEEGIAIKRLDSDGEIEDVYDYPCRLQSAPDNIIATADGYLLGGFAQHTGQTSDALILHFQTLPDTLIHGKEDNNNYQGYIDKLIIMGLPKDTAIVLPNLTFERGDHKLLPGAQRELADLAKLMVANPQLKVALAGHTSNEGDKRSNLELSMQRVKNAKHYLYQKGISPERVRLVAYGEEKPKFDNASDEGREKNRRIELIILSK